MANKVFVSPDGDEWKVKVVGNQKATARCETKAEATEIGIGVAKNYHAELFVQNLDGRIGWKNSYGHDPRKIKG